MQDIFNEKIMIYILALKPPLEDPIILFHDSLDRLFDQDRYAKPHERVH